MAETVKRYFQKFNRYDHVPPIPLFASEPQNRGLFFTHILLIVTVQQVKVITERIFAF